MASVKSTSPNVSSSTVEAPAAPKSGSHAPSHAPIRPAAVKYIGPVIGLFASSRENKAKPTPTAPRYAMASNITAPAGYCEAV